MTAKHKLQPTSEVENEKQKGCSPNVYQNIDYLQSGKDLGGKATNNGLRNHNGNEGTAGNFRAEFCIDLEVQDSQSLENSRLK